MSSSQFVKLNEFSEHDDAGEKPINYEEQETSIPVGEFTNNASTTANEAETLNTFDSFFGNLLSEKQIVLLRAVAGEFLVSFLFLFSVIATGVNEKRSGQDNLVIGGISTGFCATALIYAFADVSGAHFNPAVTFAVIVTGKTSWTKGILYMIAQLIAAILASAFMLIVFSKADALGNMTVRRADDAPLANAFFMELVLTFILVYVIFAVAFDTVESQTAVTVDSEESVGRNLTIYTTSGNSKAGFAPIAIGFTLGYLCFIGGSVSGGAFNPARSFGPALVANNWNDEWLYWIADFFGAAMAGLLQTNVFARRTVQKVNVN